MTHEHRGGGAEDEETILASRLSEMKSAHAPIETTLRTDARVIARVTDGIYRQPGSALRELISNAYDADATRVTIQTDRPRFRRIIVEDNGSGMTPTSLMHVVRHIGGSAKRTVAGIDLGITSKDDPTRSPGGRHLIGKIGIGLFSVAQLTQAFQVITKVRGDNFRTVAAISLRQYSEEAFSVVEDSSREYEAGKVLLWREPAPDPHSHGTTIILNAIRPQTRATLRSAELWQAIFSEDETSESNRPRPPQFHIGSVQNDDEGLLRQSIGSSHLPWSHGDEPSKAFKALVDAVAKLISKGVPSPSTQRVFDYYLQMVWDLSLWVPLPYVEQHPFDLTGSDDVSFFQIVKGREVKDLQVGQDETVRVAANLGNKVEPPANFSVQIDDLEISRPIKVSGLPRTSSAVKNPMLFVSSVTENFEGVDSEISAGPLSFQAYFLWAPKIAPSDHSGVMVRVHDASGMKFDPEFFRFPVAEQRRMSQISCEIFILEGFDGALNIDRESFNFAHPHAVLLLKWIHASLKRVIAVQKRVASAALKERRKSKAQDIDKKGASVARREWQSRHDDGTDPPDIVFSDEGSVPNGNDSTAAYVFDRRQVAGQLTGPNWKNRQETLENKLVQIAKILAAYSVLDSLSRESQADLMAAIREVLQAYE
ncbi:ATP-binding protein [Amycolatopsis japonica]|uniref:ATP-binding protein n=1 Tax=Amycolatopsis japonica TaxID=208439 RepID=UPI003788C01D